VAATSLAGVYDATELHDEDVIISSCDSPCKLEIEGGIVVGPVGVLEMETGSYA
jgi:hypothetical protein